MAKERKTADEKQLLYEKALNTYRKEDVPTKAKLTIEDLFEAHDSYEEALKNAQQEDNEEPSH